jgi:ABC-type multidrug transport system ATPase subunit
MLAIARALMMQPKLLILDEPTLGLAPVILEQLSKALERLRRPPTITVLLGEQNVTFALPHADRVYVLEHAHIVWEGDPGRFADEMGTGYLSMADGGIDTNDIARTVSAEEALAMHASGRPGQAGNPHHQADDHRARPVAGLFAGRRRTVPAHRPRSESLAYDYTTKGNMVAVISNGTAVLGLGNLGASPRSR